MGLSEKNIRNIFIYLMPKFAGYGLSIITLPILTRLLTPSDFGIAAMASLFPAIAVSIFTCGLTASAQRYYFEYRTDKNKLNAFLFSIQVFLYLSFFASSIIVFFLKDYIAAAIIGTRKYGLAVFISFIGAYLSQIINFYLTVYQNMGKASANSFFTIAQAFLTTLVTLGLIYFLKISYMGLIFGSLVGAIIVCLIIVFYFNRTIRVAFDFKILKDNIAYGLQVIPKSFTGFINRFFDKYMLNNMLSLSVVGVYNIGLSIGNTMFVLMSSIWSSFQPVYYKDVFDNGQAASVSVGRIFTIFSYIALVPVFFVILFAKELVFLLAPASYYKAIDVIIIALCAIATNVFGMYVGIQFAYSKKVYLLFPISIVGTIVNVIGNVFLIPRFGLIGASLSFFATYFISNALLIIVGQKLYRIQYEWKVIAGLNLLILSATVCSLYFKYLGTASIYGYLAKTILILFYITIGIMTKIISRVNIIRIFSAIFPVFKNKKGVAWD